ncbi:MAG: hypothetical protein J6V39_04095 [Clostridia bacterium]|nr:hypothetical protein [Clostridia bacterium]
MKYTGKLLALALILAAVSACAVGCVGPESDDSGVNENTDTTNSTTTTQTTTQAPTTQAPTTQAPTTETPTTEGMMGSIAGDVSEAVSDAVSGGNTTESATTQTPSRNGRMRGREGQ